MKSWRMDLRRMGLAMILCSCAWAWPRWTEVCRGELRIRDVCQIKGQEENTLQGLGLVVGLEGTGDSDTPTTRALARMMQLMGNPLGTNEKGAVLLDELKKTRNVAMVFVTATVPAQGARQGSKLECSVNAVSAKSLQGGYLMMTPLLGPRPDSSRVYAFAQGPLALEQSGPRTSAKIHQGCRLEESFANAFVKDGKITLVLDKSHAAFQTAQDIEDRINSLPDVRISDGGYAGGVAKALDQVNIEVLLPEKYVENPVLFVSMILNEPIIMPESEACVVVREREGVVVMGANVQIAPVAVAHKNLTIETGASGNTFVPLDPADNVNPAGTKLKALVDALNALKVPAEDIIDVIKGLERSGHLYGRLIIE